MEATLRVKTRASPGGGIEIDHLGLPPGEAVEVIVVRSGAPTSATGRRSVVDILAEASGQRAFKTANDVDAYLNEERDSWDR
jgi:hypothetical protein